MHDLMTQLFLSCVILATATADAVLRVNGSFFGSPALLDGYCDEAEHFIDVFTLSSERLTVEGSSSDVTRALVSAHNTGTHWYTIMSLPWYLP